ncbi:MAG: hypothetical protein GY696_15550 [Gammaproteobacteria bacterium]|nr:hypothetical protein [Gammaproteobacteria bacterium]
MNFVSTRSVGTRYRYTVQEGDDVIPVDRWRRDMLQKLSGKDSDVLNNNKKDRPMSEEELVANEEWKPRPGDECYVYQFKSESLVDVLWEGGEWELDIGKGQCRSPDGA